MQTLKNLMRICPTGLKTKHFFNIALQIATTMENRTQISSNVSGSQPHWCNPYHFFVHKFNEKKKEKFIVFHDDNGPIHEGLKDLSEFSYLPPEIRSKISKSLFDYGDKFEDQLDENMKMKVEMWSIGCIFFELLTGKLPFSSVNPDFSQKVSSIVETKKDPALSGLDSLMQKLLSIDPTQRPSGFDVLKEDLLKCKAIWKKSVKFFNITVGHQKHTRVSETPKEQSDPENEYASEGKFEVTKKRSQDLKEMFSVSHYCPRKEEKDAMEKAIDNARLGSFEKVIFLSLIHFFYSIHLKFSFSKQKTKILVQGANGIGKTTFVFSSIRFPLFFSARKAKF